MTVGRVMVDERWPLDILEVTFGDGQVLLHCQPADDMEHIPQGRFQHVIYAPDGTVIRRGHVNLPGGMCPTDELWLAWTVVHEPGWEPAQGAG